MNWLNRLRENISRKWIEYAILLAVAYILALAGIQIPKPDTPDGPIFFGVDQANRPAVVIDQGEVSASYYGGWIAAPDVADQVRATIDTPWFADTPAGKAALGEDDVFLWRAAKQVLDEDLKPRNQGQVGSCVSFGTAAAVDLLQLVDIANGANKQYKPVVQEAIYALSRVEIGGGRIRGDGSVGSWAAKAIRDYGVVPREKIGRYDLTQYSESLCRDWGKNGLPEDLEPVAKQSPVKSFAFCKTTEEVDRALSQGYPIAICSDLGVSQQRDANGFAKWDRSWAHCMAIIGKRTDIPGYYVWNSWGGSYHRGPLGVGEPPEGGFWLRKADLSRLLSSRNTECIAFSDAVGFPSRKLDWVVFHRMKGGDRADILRATRDVPFNGILRITKR